METSSMVILLFLYCLSHCRCQILTPNDLVKVTDCSSGLIADVDRLIFTGTVNLTLASIRTWRSYIDFVVIHTSSGDFLKVACYVNLNRCYRGVSTGDCYCRSFSVTAYVVVMNITATEDMNNTSVKMVWPRLDFKEIVSSKPWNVPSIYKDTAAATRLQINSENVNLLSKTCKLAALPAPSLMRYCCASTPSPCLAKIASHESTVTGAPCAVANLTVVSRYKYKFSHAVCGKVSARTVTCTGVKALPLGQASEDAPIVSGYRNAAIFLASTIAIGLIITTVHRLDTSLVFTSFTGRRPETVNMIRKY